MSTELEKFVQEEMARMDKQRDEAIKAKGLLPFISALPVGETQYRLLPIVPTLYHNKNQNNDKKLFTVTKIGSEDRLAWPVNPNSPTYREVLALLPKCPLNIAIVRTGKERQDTRYSIRVLS